MIELIIKHCDIVISDMPGIAIWHNELLFVSIKDNKLDIIQLSKKEIKEVYRFKKEIHPMTKSSIYLLQKEYVEMSHLSVTKEERESIVLGRIGLYKEDRITPIMLLANIINYKIDWNRFKDIRNITLNDIINCELLDRIY